MAPVTARYSIFRSFDLVFLYIFIIFRAGRKYLFNLCSSLCSCLPSSLFFWDKALLRNIHQWIDDVVNTFIARLFLRKLTTIIEKKENRTKEKPQVNLHCIHRFKHSNTNKTAYYEWSPFFFLIFIVFFVLVVYLLPLPRSIALVYILSKLFPLLLFLSLLLTSNSWYGRFM